MRSTSRAGSPLLFGLAPRGVFRASGVATEAVGSYPTFSPLPNVARILASLRFPCVTATVLRPAGGLFSVALSVAAPHRPELGSEPHALPRNSALRQSLRGWPPDAIRRVAHVVSTAGHSVAAFRRPQTANVPHNGVRTFLPFRPL
jgi:hypothetical protein